MNYLPIEFGVLSGMRCGDVVPPNGSASDLLMPAYFWRQRVSGASGFLVAAHFWWQPTSGVNAVLMSIHFWCQPIPDVIHYSCESIVDVNTLSPGKAIEGAST